MLTDLSTMSPRFRELFEKQKRAIAPIFTPKQRYAFVPAQHVQRTTRRPLPHTYLDDKVAPFEKLHRLYHHLIHEGYYINPTLELVYGNRRQVGVDAASNSQMTIGDQMFNAPLTFTILTSLINNGKLIYFGLPGLGKTTLPEYAMSALFNMPIEAIQHATIFGHPQLTEEKMVAMFDIVKMLNRDNPARSLIVHQFLRSPVKLIDEVNRIPPETMSILYQLVDRGFVEYHNIRINATPGPLFATANPPDSGNYEMPLPIRDRFDIGLVVSYLDPFHYGEFTAKRDRKIKTMLDHKVTPPAHITEYDRMAAQHLIGSVSFPDGLMAKFSHFAAELIGCDRGGITIDRKTKAFANTKKPGALCEGCRYNNAPKSICSCTENALSTRTVQTIYAYSKALAAWRGSSQVDEQDLAYAIMYSTWFKLVPTRSGVERNEYFINDQLSMVESLYHASQQSFAEACKVVPAYQQITKLVMDFALYTRGRPLPITKDSLSSMMEQTAKIDSIAKFPLMTTLRYMQSLLP